MSDSETESKKGSHDRCRLNTGNYSEWAIRMEALLIRKDLWDVVEPEEETTEGETEEDQGEEAEEAEDNRSRKDMAKARALMIEYAEKSQLVYMTERDPRKIWTKLKGVHQSRGLATEMGYRRRLSTLKKTSGQTMEAWIGSIIGIQWELGEIGVSITDKEVILALTNGLGSEYESFVVSLDATPVDDMTLDFVIQRLLNEESRRVSTGITGSTETALRATPAAPRVCWFCEEPGHIKANCEVYQSWKEKKDAEKAEKAPEKSLLAITAMPNYAL